MRSVLLGLLTLALMVGPLLAEGKKTGGGRADQLTDLKDQFKKALPDFWTASEAATATGDQEAALQPLLSVWAKAVKLADAADDAVAVESLMWVLDSSEGAPHTPKFLALLESLPATKTAKAHREVAGLATLTLATTYQRQADLLPAKQRDAAAALATKAEKLLEHVEKDYANVLGRAGTLGQAAKQALYELRNLAVGKPAPEAEGTDLDGKKAKLSDYKGRVLVLDIWTTWCGPCRAMIPHQRELVKRLKGKPFVMLSVNADAKKETLTQFLEKEPMPWQHWHNGVKADKGGVRDVYSVHFFPSIYVIDAKGIIRHKNVRGEALDKAVDALLKEQEKPGD